MAGGRWRLSGKDVVIVLALIAAGAYGAWIVLHSQGGFGRQWTDGQRTYENVDDVRFAVWEDPERVEGAVNSGEREGRAALSPDGRYLVFTVGERGLNTDLYLAELRDGVAVDPRPIHALNTGSDELAPAFSSDGLYFASDRSGPNFGLDLWRAPYDDGRFGIAESLGPTINTAADETDPLPLPRSAELLFASDRERGLRTDYDLYLATPSLEDGGRGFVVHDLPELSSPFDEREPGCTADGRVLVFASDRDGPSEAGGSFDLYRSLRDGPVWLPPSSLDGVNTAASERAPLVSPDGFALTYSRAALADPSDPEGAAPDADLFRARSLELFALPPRAIGLLDLLILLALLLLALLAFLAKRWRGMEVLYKCFLISLLIHLLLLWYLRAVYPEGDPYSLGGEDRLFRVRVERSGPMASAANRERGGDLQATRTLTDPEREPGRLESQLEVASAAPAARSVERQAHEEALPGREGLNPVPEVPHTESVVQLADSDAPFERHAAEAPALSLAAGPRMDAPRRTDGGAPVRAESADSTPDTQPTAFQALARGERALDAVPAPAELTARPSRRANEGGATVSVVQPSEQLAKKSGEVAGFALPAAASIAAPTRDAAGPERATSQNALAVSSSPGEDPLPREPGPIASVERPQLREGELPERRAATQTPHAERGRPEVELQDRRVEELTPPARPVDAPKHFDPTTALADAPRRAPRVPTPDELAPKRFRFENDRESEVAPESRVVAAAAPPAAPADDIPERLTHTPYRNRFGEEKEKALEIYGGGEETEAAVAAGLEYLASIQHEDGFWGSPADRHDKYHHVLVGKTGLALLAFLGAGHTQDSETEYSQVVIDAIELLLAIQDGESGHFGYSSSYSHAIATYALAECYAITEDEELRAPLERAVAHVLKNQDRRSDSRLHGGWGYYYPDGRVWNNDRWPRVSVTAWQVMALESARIGGLSVPDETFTAAREFIANAWDEERGAIRYCHDPGRLSSYYPILPASTPAGLFALSLMGVDLNDESVSGPVAFVLERTPRSYRHTSDDDFIFRAQGNLYFWYYGTLAMFRAGGSKWNRWNARMKDVLLDGQEADGSWEPISVYADYAGDDRRDRSYTTAMCVLTLEVYYRYFTPLLEVR